MQSPWRKIAAHAVVIVAVVVMFVYDAFPLEIGHYGASARLAQALPALRRRATVFRVVPFRTLFDLRFGLRT